MISRKAYIAGTPLAAASGGRKEKWKEGVSQGAPFAITAK